METPEQAQFCNEIIKKRGPYKVKSEKKKANPLVHKMRGLRTRLKNRKQTLSYYEENLRKPPTPWWIGEGKAFMLQQIENLKKEISSIEIELKTITNE